MKWLSLIAISICGFAHVQLGLGHASEAKPVAEPMCCFTAKVKWIEPVGEREGKAVPIGTQPELNWLVGIEIRSIEKPAKAFDKKGERILMIHSPVLFFARPADEVIGRQYSFKVFGEVKDSVPRYRYAELKEKKSRRTSQPD